eukprot:GHVS01021762.1.p1 GENE.GHVS01021762.1~~GHVS01021762.1.p1  ORF type:complete len:735 (+),score=105.88 GHVS01021762.1:297-2501(+)
MTLGIDVSKLFSEMVMASCTTDLVQKKMIYLYLTNYAESNPDLAILAVNTLQKDCRDDDPTVRGLALRSLCSLRLTNMIEYLEPAIRRALVDVNGYVRRCAVIGCVKLFHINKQCGHRPDLLDILYKLLYDQDTQVAANAIHALNEILVDEGGLMLTKEIAVHLLNRIKQFNEWGQCAILNLISSYSAESPQEMFDIMNILEERLKHSSSAVVLGCTKCFVELTLDKPDLHFQVLQRLKAPLLTLMSTSTPELSYTVLLHIQLLLQEGLEKTASVMEDDFKQFFCRYSDPSYVKTVKLDILTLIASQANVDAILAEASEYVGDVDADIAKRSIHALATIAIKIPTAVAAIVQQLLSYLELEIDYVTTATLSVMKDILRKYPEHFDDIASSLNGCGKVVSEPEALAAVVWMLGEFGECLEDAPYLLEHMIKSSTEDGTCLVRLELLTAAVKLFIKRPPEMQDMLGALLQKGVQEWSQPEVHDKALFYYRLLTYSVPETRRVVNCLKTRVTFFQEDMDKEAVNRLFREFNSLSVVYAQPASQFCAMKQIPFHGTFKYGSSDLRRKSEEEEKEDIRGGGGDAKEESRRATVQTCVGTMETGNDLIGLQDEPLRLRSEKPPMDPSMFQRQWTSLTACAVLKASLDRVVDLERVEAACTAAHVYTMASGEVEGSSGPLMKLYLYAQDTNICYYFVEMLVQSAATSSVEVTVKTTGSSGHRFTDLFCVAMRSVMPSLRVV